MPCPHTEREAMSQTYCFPILSDQELAYFMRELDMPLTVAQLAKPTYEAVKPAFEHAIMTLVGTTRCTAT